MIQEALAHLVLGIAAFVLWLMAVYELALEETKTGIFLFILGIAVGYIALVPILR